MNVAVNNPGQVQCWYESFRSHFIAMGTRSGCSKEEVSDLISQLFLDLLEKNIDPQTINNPQAWLSTVFRRKLIDHYRSSSKNRFVDATVRPILVAVAAEAQDAANKSPATVHFTFALADLNMLLYFLPL